MNKILWVSLALLAVFNVLFWFGSYGESSQDLYVTLLDVGQGDAIYIETPSGKQILIDAGPDTSVLRELSGVMPFWDRSLDMIILTHADKDHIAGFPEILRRYSVANILSTSRESDTSFFRAFDEARSKENTEEIEVKRGQIINLGDGAVLTILFPDASAFSRNINDTSIVARLDYGNTSFLFTGDIGENVEEYLLTLHKDDNVLNVDVLKVGHHGSKTSSSLAFLEAVTPEYALISAGADNRFGHPNFEVLDNLSLFTEDIFCTCDLSEVSIVSDGESLRVEF